jgi:hypothetical protein
VSPYEKAMAALKHEGLLRGGKAHCPTCPPSKRRGFEVTEEKTAAGIATVLFHCFRGCDTLTEIVPALGLDPADLYDGGLRQEALFEKDRFCPITLLGWKALPPSVARTFGIAAAIGYFSTPRSPFRLLRSSEQWAAIRQEAGIDDRLLRTHVEKWIDREMAHRCFERGVLALYRGPLERCPNCGRPTREGSFITRMNARKGTSDTARRHGSHATQLKARSHPVKGALTPFMDLFPEGDGGPDWGKR